MPFCISIRANVLNVFLDERMNDELLVGLTQTSIDRYTSMLDLFPTLYPVLGCSRPFDRVEPVVAMRVDYAFHHRPS